MFGVPKQIAKAMESNRVMRLINRLAVPFLKTNFQKNVKEGITSIRSAKEAMKEDYIPLHLQGILHAGKGRSQALQRWILLDLGRGISSQTTALVLQSTPRLARASGSSPKKHERCLFGSPSRQ